MNIRKVNLFLALTFGLSWSTAVVLYLSDIEYGGLTSLVLVVMFFMWAPAIAAFGVQIWYGDPIRTGTGLVRGRLRWIVLAWVAPVALLAVVVGLGWPSPECR